MIYRVPGNNEPYKEEGKIYYDEADMNRKFEEFLRDLREIRYTIYLPPSAVAQLGGWGCKRHHPQKLGTAPRTQRAWPLGD